MDSNHRPPAYKTGTLTAELQALKKLVGEDGFEPPYPEGLDLQSNAFNRSATRPLIIFMQLSKLLYLHLKDNGSKLYNLFPVNFLEVVAAILDVADLK